MNFPFVPSGKLIILGIPNLGTLQLKIFGHLKTINFPFGTNGKFKVLGVPILKHFRVHFAFQSAGEASTIRNKFTQKLKNKLHVPFKTRTSGGSENDREETLGNYEQNPQGIVDGSPSHAVSTQYKCKYYIHNKEIS